MELAVETAGAVPVLNACRPTGGGVVPRGANRYNAGVVAPAGRGRAPGTAVWGSCITDISY